MVVAAPGPVLGVTTRVSLGPVPQELVALTIIVPEPVPIPARIEDPTLEPSMDQPLPNTVHEYERGLPVAVSEKVALAIPAQMVSTGKITSLGIGNGVTVNV